MSINTLKTLANNGKINSFKTTGEEGEVMPSQQDIDALILLSAGATVGALCMFSAFACYAIYRWWRPFVFLLLIVPAHGWAQADLPCGEPEQVRALLRWQVPAQPVLRYRVHRGTATRLYSEIVDATDVLIGADGIAVGHGGTFDTSRTHYVALTAIGEGGESMLSNELEIPAEVRVCVPPDPPVLLDVIRRIEAIEAQLRGMREALQP